MTHTRFDAVVVGGGIVGTATAMALAREGLEVAVLEAEPRLASHQSGHNSGVIHSGLYYRPGSAKARNCVAGRAALLAFCQEHDVAYEQCGKLVVATSADEVLRLHALAQRGSENGLQGLELLGPDGIGDVEPHAAGLAALLVPETGIVDYVAVTQAYAKVVIQHGGEVRTGVEVLRAVPEPGGVLVETDAGPWRGKLLVNCAGLRSDRLARSCGLDPGVRVVPFRGDFYELAPASRHLVRNLIYPVPDPELPFLGVHFTRMIDGAVEAGPNAVLSFHRHGYHRAAFSVQDTLETLGWPGFWRMALRMWRPALDEMVRAWSADAFVESLRKLVPGITRADVRPARCGIRAQALGRDGQLLDDFHIVRGERMLHLLNAPSPAATASIAIGTTLGKMAQEMLGGRA